MRRRRVMSEGRNRTSTGTRSCRESSRDPYAYIRRTRSRQPHVSSVGQAVRRVGKGPAPLSHRNHAGLRSWPDQASRSGVNVPAVGGPGARTGLVVLTGRGHAGAVNIGRHAQRLTVVSAVAALVDGLHLSGPAFEPAIGPTVDALPAMAPGLVAPGQCTGWRAQHALVAALPTPGPPAAPDRRYCVHGA